MCWLLGQALFQCTHHTLPLSPVTVINGVMRSRVIKRVSFTSTPSSSGTGAQGLGEVGKPVSEYFVANSSSVETEAGGVPQVQKS